MTAFILGGVAFFSVAILQTFLITSQLALNVIFGLKSELKDQL